MTNNKNESDTKNKRITIFCSCLKDNSDIIQAICSIFSVVIIGVCSIFFWAKEANKISSKQFYFSSQPYFTISEIGNGGLENYEICNEGGYIQNATLELNNMLEIEIYKKDEFIKTLYVPFGTNIKDLYNIKNKSFTINNPKYVMEASEMDNRIYSYYADAEYNIKVFQFQYIDITYLNFSHDYIKEKYLIGIDVDVKEDYLVPLSEELMQKIYDNIPKAYKNDDVYFPDGTISRINLSGERGTTRTFIDNAEYEAEKIIEEINHVLN